MVTMTGMFVYGYVVGFREALETALLVAIALGALARLGRADLRRHLWLGVVAALAASLALVRLSLAWGGFLEGRSGRVFEAAMMTLTVVLLTGIITWMQRHAREARSLIEGRLAGAATRSSLAVGLVAFLLVLREGTESTVLLWGGIAMGIGQGVFEGAAAGIATAVLLGLVFARRTGGVPSRRFFRLSSILLLIFAAAILTNAVRICEELGFLPPLSGPLWDTSRILDERSPVGSMVQVLLGYGDHPTLMELASWLAYVVIVGRRVIASGRRDLAAAVLRPPARGVDSVGSR